MCVGLLVRGLPLPFLQPLVTAAAAHAAFLFALGWPLRADARALSPPPRLLGRQVGALMALVFGPHSPTAEANFRHFSPPATLHGPPDTRLPLSRLCRGYYGTFIRNMKPNLIYTFVQSDILGDYSRGSGSKHGIVNAPAIVAIMMPSVFFRNNSRKPGQITRPCHSSQGPRASGRTAS